MILMIMMMVMMMMMIMIIHTLYFSVMPSLAAASNRATPIGQKTSKNGCGR